MGPLANLLGLDAAYEGASSKSSPILNNHNNSISRGSRAVKYIVLLTFESNKVPFREDKKKK